MQVTTPPGAATGVGGRAEALAITRRMEALRAMAQTTRYMLADFRASGFRCQGCVPPTWKKIPISDGKSVRAEGLKTVECKLWITDRGENAEEGRSLWAGGFGRAVVLGGGGGGGGRRGAGSAGGG